VLKTIAEDLGIKRKLKKDEIATVLPEELINYLQVDLLTKSVEQILNDHQIFKKHPIMAELMRKFHEIQFKSQQMQQKLQAQQIFNQPPFMFFNP
jgi:hypothetical protein